MLTAPCTADHISDCLCFSTTRMNCPLNVERFIKRTNDRNCAVMCYRQILSDNQRIWRVSHFTRVFQVTVAADRFLVNPLFCFLLYDHSQSLQQRLHE